MGFSRLLQKIKRKDGSPPSRRDSLATPRPTAVPDPSSSSLQERLWNQAYDTLRADEPKIAEAYEKFLSTELQNNGGSSLAANEDGLYTERGHQMERLIQIGLRRTEKAAVAKQKIGDGLQTVNIVKSLVGSAVQTAPVAAIAWVGVCFALEVLSNTFAEARANRKGLAYVVSRMDWYWNLVDLLLDAGANTELHGLRGQLEDHILQLYQRLLLYQMKSVCLYHQNHGVVVLKDMARLDDWRGQLDEIKDAEAAVERDSEQYSSQRAQTHLRNLAATAERQCTELQLIASVVQEQTNRQQQMHQDEKDKQCLHDLYETDPRHDKTRIQGTKGGLLRDSYAWILENPDFKDWRADPDRRLFWVKGDPGKGKTMLLCGIIDELEKDATNPLAYFFCQATEQKLNNATAVLRGLIYTLVRRYPPLIAYLRKEYDGAGKQQFVGLNSWEVMSKILTAILDDPILDGALFVVDALDECGAGRQQLLMVIVHFSATFRAKWIVSSRNWPDIEEKLGSTAAQTVTLRLELNEDSISHAVHVYIRYKVGELARLKKYDNETRDAIYQYFTDKSNNTFLWVALVYHELADPKVRKRHTLDVLKTFPPGLDSLYQRMIENICNSNDADLYTQVLAVVSVVYRPVTLQELTSIVDSIAPFKDDLESLEEIIGSCGSFLTLRNGSVYFVHQSAKDYLLEKASAQVLPGGIALQHYAIFSTSLKVLSRTLRRDIYGLRAPGFSIDHVSPPDPDPLEPVRYSCIHWADHFRDSHATESRDLQGGDLVHRFLKSSYLYWLEALSLLRSISQAALAVQMLETLMGGTETRELTELLRDARRFILSHRRAIEIAPLQLYASALVFSPAHSLIRSQYKGEAPNWIISTPTLEPDWNACVQTLEGHSSQVLSVAFLADGRQLASGSGDNTVKVWDALTGACMHTLEGHSGPVSSVAFSADGQQLASGSRNDTVKIWDTVTGICVRTLECYSGLVTSVAASVDGQWLGSESDDKTIHAWDVVTGVRVQRLKGYCGLVMPVASSADGRWLASGSGDTTVKLWDATTGINTRTLKGHVGPVLSVAFSADSRRLASGSGYSDNIIYIWDVGTGVCMQTLKGHGGWVVSVAFSANGKRLASGSRYSDDIKVWDVETGACEHSLKGHSQEITSVAFSADGRRLVSGSADKTVKVWDIATGIRAQTLEGHGGWVTSVAFSADGRWLASGSSDQTVKVWGAATGMYMRTLQSHEGRILSVAFSADSQRLALASGSDEGTITIWNPSTGARLQTLRGHNDLIASVTFSTDGRWLASASASSDTTVKVWDTMTGACVRTFEGHCNTVWSVAFSVAGQQLASGSSDKTIKIWDTATGVCVRTLEGHGDWVMSVAFSADDQWLASGSADKTIKVWDAATGACVQTLEVGRPTTRLSFSTGSNTQLSTNFGGLALDPSAMSTRQLDASAGESQLHGYGISSDNVWIVKHSERLLWLPAEVRPRVSAVAGSTVALGCATGRVLVIQLLANELDP